MNSGEPTKVLYLEVNRGLPHAYSLDQANRGGGTDLQVKWADAKHLAISYDGSSTVLLQTVHVSGITIGLLNTTSGRYETGLRGKNSGT